MAYITLDRRKLRHNYEYLNRLFDENGIRWSVVSKLLCGHPLFLEELRKLGVTRICDSRMGNVKAIKKIAPDIETMCIRPPALRAIPDIIRYVDISFNTEYATLEKLSAEASRQGKVHKVIIMIELGELREGVLRDDVLPIYEKTLTLPHIKIVGVGTNLSCLSGILPDYDKLNQLCLYRDLLHAKFGQDIPYVSGGTSVTIPLLTDKVVPAGINHFRIGETLFFGNDLYHDSLLPDMEHDVLKLHAEIIELEEKPLIPEGRLGTNLEGDTPEFDRNDRGKTSVRAILDIGLLDVEHTHIFPDDNAISCCGACSDMLVVDLGENLGQYKTGDTIAFSMDYMGAVRLMNSRYIRKRIIE